MFGYSNSYLMNLTRSFGNCSLIANFVESGLSDFFR